MRLDELAYIRAVSSMDRRSLHRRFDRELMSIFSPFRFPFLHAPSHTVRSTHLALFYSPRRSLHSTPRALARRPRHPYRPPIPHTPPTPAALPPRRSIFWLLPSFLRPSLRHLIGLDFLLDQNQDMANASNADYVALRNNAIREGDLMGKAFTASKQAYNAGDGGRAHDLSMEGKEHQRKRDQYNDQAANWIYTGACARDGLVIFRAGADRALTRLQRTTRSNHEEQLTCTAYMSKSLSSTRSELFR